MEKIEETYESLEEFFNEQDKLIAEGKIQKPQIVYGLDEASLAAVKRGITAEMVFKELEEKYGLKG